MATVIDALLVTLGLDNSDFKKGIKDSAKEQDSFTGKSKKSTKDISDAEKKTDKERAHQFKENQQRAKATLEGFTKLRNEALAFLTIFTAGRGLLSFISDTITASAAIGRLSENVGMGVGELSGWQVAMKDVGGSAEGASNAITKAAEAVAAYHIGMPNSAVQGFFTAGGTDAAGALKDTRSFLLAQADLIHNLWLKDPTGAMYKARQMMGVDEDTFNLLKQGRVAVMKQVEAGERLTGMNEAQSKAAQRAQRQWIALTETMDRQGRKILFKVLTPISDWVTKHSKDINAWADRFGKALSDIDPKTIDHILSAMNGIAQAIIMSVEGWERLIDLFGQTGTTDTNPNGTPKTQADINAEERGDRDYYARRAAKGLQVPMRYSNAVANNSQVAVGPVNIYTQSTDAAGMAADAKAALSKRLNNLMWQGNSGMTSQ